MDIETNERLEFQYNPDDIADDKSTDYAAVQIPGMSLPNWPSSGDTILNCPQLVIQFRGHNSGDTFPLPASSPTRTLAPNTTFS